MDDDRTAMDRENANREQAPRSPVNDSSSRDGRVRDAGDTRADQRSSPGRPALTDREREERWPLG
jgi:hypothetical protein